MTKLDPDDDAEWQAAIQTIRRLSVRNARYQTELKKPTQSRLLSMRADAHYTISQRLDLHGLTVDEAFTTVAAFIRMAYRFQWRSVEIITGRGNAEHGTGALRRELPFWLENLNLSPYISKVEVKDSSRGGAFTVMLRRSKT